MSHSDAAAGHLKATGEATMRWILGLGLVGAVMLWAWISALIIRDIGARP